MLKKSVSIPLPILDLGQHHLPGTLAVDMAGVNVVQIPPPYQSESVFLSLVRQKEELQKVRLSLLSGKWKLDTNATSLLDERVACLPEFEVLALKDLRPSSATIAERLELHTISRQPVQVDLVECGFCGAPLLLGSSPKVISQHIVSCYDSRRLGIGSLVVGEKIHTLSSLAWIGGREVDTGLEPPIHGDFAIIPIDRLRCSAENLARIEAQIEKLCKKLTGKHRKEVAGGVYDIDKENSYSLFISGTLCPLCGHSLELGTPNNSAITLTIKDLEGESSVPAARDLIALMINLELGQLTTNTRLSDLSLPQRASVELLRLIFLTPQIKLVLLDNLFVFLRSVLGQALSLFTQVIEQHSIAIVFLESNASQAEQEVSKYSRKALHCFSRSRPIVPPHISVESHNLIGKTTLVVPKRPLLFMQSQHRTRPDLAWDERMRVHTPFRITSKDEADFLGVMLARPNRSILELFELQNSLAAFFANLPKSQVLEASFEHIRAFLIGKKPLDPKFAEVVSDRLQLECLPLMTVAELPALARICGLDSHWAEWVARSPLSNRALNNTLASLTRFERQIVRLVTAVKRGQERLPPYLNWSLCKDERLKLLDYNQSYPLSIAGNSKI